MGANLFPANIATCPSCGSEFSHNKINGLSLVAAVSDINARVRMHQRLTLNAIEQHTDLSEPAFKAIRKVIMDNFNDLGRDVQVILGLDDEAE